MHSSCSSSRCFTQKLSKRQIIKPDIVIRILGIELTVVGGIFIIGLGDVLNGSVNIGLILVIIGLLISVIGFFLKNDKE